MTRGLHYRQLLCLSTLIAMVLLAGRGGAAEDEWMSPSVMDPLERHMAKLRLYEGPTLISMMSYHETAGSMEENIFASGVSSVGEGQNGTDLGESKGLADDAAIQPLPSWFEDVSVGYENGFVIASGKNLDAPASSAPFVMRINGLGQLRHTYFGSKNPNSDLNQFQLIRGRLSFSGSAFTPNLRYFVQLDGRSSAGDEFRLLDYLLEFDAGSHFWGMDRDSLVFKTGKYKIPFTFARYLSSREFQFADRSMASMYFDVNRSLAWGLSGCVRPWGTPINWEMAIFNGLVTGGAETGSSGTLDNNFAYSGRIFAFPSGNWGSGGLADFDWQEQLATRIGAGYAGSTIDRTGTTEFNLIRVVDSGEQLGSLLPMAIYQYEVNMFCVDASCKYLGWSMTSEYYFRSIDGFQGDALSNLFDHGFWLQIGKFIVPRKLELLTRWSRVVGNSGTLGQENQSAEEIAGGFAWYFRDQNAKLTFDATHLDGAPISSSALDIYPGAIGWLFRTQIQIAF